MAKEPDAYEEGQEAVEEENNTQVEETEEDNREQAEEAEEKETKSKGAKIRGALLELVLYVVILVVCVTLIPRYVLQRTIVDGESMMETLQHEENLLVEKVTYRFSDPERFDIIVFYPYGEKEEDYYIKRVIGLPGENVKINGDTIYINDKELEENYGKDPMAEDNLEITLGDDEYFVLGDNRDVSQDSRDIGPIQREDIDGQAILRIYPFSKFGTID